MIVAKSSVLQAGADGFTCAVQQSGTLEPVLIHGQWVARRQKTN